MLYDKDVKKRSYEHLRTHTSSEQVHRLQRKGKVTLSGKPKKKQQ